VFIADLGLADFASYDLRSLRHRDHGGLAVAGRGDEARRGRDEMEEVTIIYGMTRLKLGVDETRIARTTSNVAFEVGKPSCHQSRCRSSIRVWA